MDKRFSSNKYVVSNLKYHIVWCSKYKKPLLIKEVEERLKQLLLEKAEQEGWDIIDIKVTPNSVCVVIKTTPSDSPITVASRLKGHTSSKLRQEFPNLKKKLPTLWTRNFFVTSIGNISEKIVKKYITNQKVK